jgi:uncharacterized membrane protein
MAFLALFACVAGAAATRLNPSAATILGFDIAALAFIAACLPLWLSDDLDAIRARTARDDGGRVLLPVVAVLLATVLVLALGRLISDRQTLDASDLAVVAVTLSIAWVFANLVFAFHYGHVYYATERREDAGGLAFPSEPAPLFADFAYFSFVIGMTCQVSDVAVTSRRMRRIVALHGMFSFFFNLGVLAMTINVLSGVL